MNAQAGKSGNGQAGMPGKESPVEREDSAAQFSVHAVRADVNFGAIVNLDVTGGLHVLRLDAAGSFTAEAVAMKVLRQFFPGELGWSGGLPTPLRDLCFETREWGTKKVPGRRWRSAIFNISDLKLVAHYVPDGDAGSLVLKTVSADLAIDTTLLPLTEREQEISALVAAGKTNAEIGLVLGISARTVQKHLENIFRKLGVETRMGLAMKAASLQRGNGG